ncbi:MAG TPA: Holliday junction resolvase RuvX [Acidimicrobiia bacterium]|nr:Holliday junction resolvase RuvX [Acidimicrobiia bacterium]
MAAVTAVTARALGVDLGSRRIGLALSDPSRTVATPHDVVIRSGDPAADHRAILDAARAAGATTIVVGLPLSLDGRAGPAARAALAEIEALHALAGSGIDVVAYDERLTTVTAERALREARMRREARRRVVDKVAAAVMLQSWLDSGEPPA